ncbi:Dabb family protein [Verticiella sediminum]|uniref:Dabb family protein n=1 Tax=Verticiella sediminum TaxID=1247510 RepID=A0A556AEB1_9BURK|nr:Dabb family protein [Verticiella sediminum]TSH91217.1 Dabb family protein [Verticiella sediminum]
MAIKHIVMWNLRGESAREKASAIELLRSRFESLRGRIPGLLHLEVGVDSSGAAYACDVVLYSVFDSEESLASYATHPAHLQVRDELGNLRISRHQVDYVADAAPLHATASQGPNAHVRHHRSA